MENVQDDHRLCRFYDMLLNSYNVLVDNMVPLSLLIILRLSFFVMSILELSYTKIRKNYSWHELRIL